MTLQPHTPEQSPDNTPCVVYHSFELAKNTFENSWRTAGSEPIQPNQLRKMKVCSYQRTLEGVRLWWEDVRPTLAPDQRVMVVMEVTSNYSLECAAWLKKLCPEVEVAIVMGARIRSWAQALGLTAKTDKIDARVIACYGAERRPTSYVAPGETEMKLRALLRMRQDYTEQRTANRQRLKETQSEHLEESFRKVLQSSIETIIEALEQQCKEIDNQVEKLIAQDPRLASDVEQLDRLTGVGWHTAVVVLAELGDLRRFATRGQLVAMAGLNPVTYQSGTSVNRYTRISKRGSSHLRRSLYLATLAGVRKDGPFWAMYNHLLEQGKKKMVALVAVMRKMLLVMRAVLISGKPFDPSYGTATGQELVHNQL